MAQTDPGNHATYKNLKRLGIQLAIDDFGTGSSSSSSLKHLNVDYLKIDKYFIDDILSDKKTCILIRATIQMGDDLGYEVISEGVETLEQLDALKKLGGMSVQGSLFSNPVSTNKIPALLNHQFAI
jgi:EAL domain-containing protein (putative c-di-GMP-specific phosphodiesterase class I)